jgi:hypothetical protein
VGDRELETQQEAAQEATPGGRRQNGGDWRSRLRRGGRGSFRDTVTQAYERLPRPGRWLVWLVVIAFFALLPEMLPYVTADASY